MSIIFIWNPSKRQNGMSAPIRVTKGQNKERISKMHTHRDMENNGFLRGGSDDSTKVFQFRILRPTNHDASG
jgi:hypothetical protein